MTKNYKNHIGIDVSKKTVDISVLKNKEKCFYVCVSNDKQGFKKLNKELTKHSIIPEETLVCIENTGLYGYDVSCWFALNNYNVWVQNAVAIRRSSGIVRTKNDKVDSHYIALYCARFQDSCKLWKRSRKAVFKLQRLISARKILVKELSALRKSFGENDLTMDKDIQKTIGEVSAHALKGIQKSINKVEQEINELIKNDDRITEMIEILT